MQARPSLPVNNPEAVAGARRAESLLPTTRTLVSNAIVKLAKEYDLYGTAVARARISAATHHASRRSEGLSPTSMRVIMPRWFCVSRERSNSALSFWRDCARMKRND